MIGVYVDSSDKSKSSGADSSQSEGDPWERWQNETAKAYEAFCAYRDMLPRDRSLMKAWRLLSGNAQASTVPGKITDWCTRYTWTDRVRAYDIAQERKERTDREAEHSKALESYRKRMLDLSKAAGIASVQLLMKASARLAAIEPKDIPTRSLPAFFRAAAHVAEVSGDAEATALGVIELSKLLEETETGE